MTPCGVPAAAHRGQQVAPGLVSAPARSSTALSICQPDYLRPGRLHPPPKGGGRRNLTCTLARGHPSPVPCRGNRWSREEPPTPTPPPPTPASPGRISHVPAGNLDPRPPGRAAGPGLRLPGPGEPERGAPGRFRLHRRLAPHARPRLPDPSSAPGEGASVSTPWPARGGPRPGCPTCPRGAPALRTQSLGSRLGPRHPNLNRPRPRPHLGAAARGGGRAPNPGGAGGYPEPGGGQGGAPGAPLGRLATREHPW